MPGAQRRKEERERQWREAAEARIREEEARAAEAAQEANVRRAHERVKVRDRWYALFGELKEPRVVAFHDRDGGYLVLDTGAAVVPSISGHVEPLPADEMHRLVGRTVQLRLPTRVHFEKTYRAPGTGMDHLDPAACLAHRDAVHCVERVPVLLDREP